ncbi:hypothetical protein MNBD_PLANCTO03-1918 [hydrothermal vent metagenome]|uniref:Uncharacterized protein n=1 Tax=hydrothermal vent metagenome TaxID=652676 RepID=A0A3B1DK84_9ZZZZ
MAATVVLVGGVVWLVVAVGWVQMAGG